MRSHIIYVFGFVAALAAAAAPAQAADCKLQMLATADTETDEAGGMLLPGNFGGTRKLLVVDTGGFFHVLKRGVVRELGLPTRESQSVAAVDVLGNRSSTVARAPVFSFGNLAPTPMDFIVMDDSGLLGGDNIAGAYSPDTLYRSYDIDLDFVGHKFNLLSPDHCPGTVVYWPNSGVAVVPFTFHDNDIVFPVQVDGTELMAAMDSGSSRTTMFTRAALRLGVNVESSGDVAETGQLGNMNGARTYEHRFRSLSIAGLTVNNPMISLIPDLNPHTQSGPSTSGGFNDTRLSGPRSQARPDMLLGMSILRRLHVYIATKEQKLYITAGAAPSAPVSQP